MAGLHGVHNILNTGGGMSELLQSFVRVDMSDDEQSEPEEKLHKNGTKTSGGVGMGLHTRLPLIGSLMSAPKRDIYSPQRKESTNDNETEKPLIIPELVGSGKGGQKKSKGHGSNNVKTKRSKKKGRRRKKRVPRCEELYTDKDRAAAVNMGSRDIKQSLSMKLKQDRSKALQIPEEADPGTFLALGNHEMKCGDVQIAKKFLDKAIDMNEKDKNALLARSKCHILMGNAEKALEDASLAVNVSKNDIEAIYQKAEALYFLGQFEHSLMYYHRGLRIRPELFKFRHGIQKAQKAIINTIGPAVKLKPLMATADQMNNNIPSYTDRSSTFNIPMDSNPSRRASSCNPTSTRKPSISPFRMKSASPGSSMKSTPSSSYTNMLRNNPERKPRQYLGALSVDKRYLEKLLKDPDIRCLNKENKDVLKKAEEALTYLNNREKFWIQHFPPATNNYSRNTTKRNSTALATPYK